MLLRNKTMVCTVPRKNGQAQEPQAAFPDPNLSAVLNRERVETFRETSVRTEEQTRFKLLVFRMPESLKMDFKVALLKNHLDIQHTFEAFAEIFISWAQGEKLPDAMKAVVKRTITLMNGV